MTDDQFNALQKEMREGFRAMNVKVDEGFADIRFALYAIMGKLLAPVEVTAIRSRMKADDVSDQPDD